MAGTIGARALKARLGEADNLGVELAVLDVREAGQYSAGHLFAATHVPFSRLELEVESFVPRKATPIVLYDHGDDVAVRASAAVESLGYSDVSVLDGGAPAWRDEGYTLYEGVNLPSKTFGELVEHVQDTPRINADELAQMQADGGDFIILDGRTPEEYRRFNIPGGISCPNAELPLRFDDLVPVPATTVVINCAGRTRSIIGAQTLINFGVPNKVVALENGTQGWALSDRELETDARRFPPSTVTPAALESARARADAVTQKYGLNFVDAETLQQWQDDDNRSLFLLDVRSRDEYAAGHLPGARHAPGGQLVQATDRWVGVRGARLVVCDDTLVRAISTAHWLKQMGWNVHVLEDGIGTERLERGHDKPASTFEPPALKQISVQDTQKSLGAGQTVAFDLRSSHDYRSGHVPGSAWSVRPLINEETVDGKDVILIADDGELAALAGSDIKTYNAASVAVMSGGMSAWQAEGYALERSPDVPSDAARIDFVAFTAERHGGNKDHMRRYLEWETGLIDQLDEQESAMFSIPTP